MQRGRMLRIILVILILGMGGFLIVRNINLKKQLKNGEITEITPKDFLPFGSNGSGSTFKEIIKEITGGNNNNEDNKTQKKNITKISENVAGAILTEVQDEVAGPTGKDINGKDIYEMTQSIRYVIKENGYVYDYLPKYDKSYLISDTPIPKVSYAHFSPDGNTILFQYLEENLITEKSILGTLGKQNVTLLPDNIISYAFSKSGKFAYTQKTTTGAKIIIKNTDTGAENQIYTTPITEWNLQFLGEDQLLITTKASEYSNGFAYTIDINTKKVSKLWSNITALTTKTSLGGKFILSAKTLPSGPEISLYDVKKGTPYKLDKMGMVEKCSFSQDETILTCAVPAKFTANPYPDDWYLGIIKTNDTIVRYTTENKNYHVVGSLSNELNKDIDVWELSTNNSGNIVSFIDKSNMDLYVYEE